MPRGCTRPMCRRSSAVFASPAREPSRSSQRAWACQPVRCSRGSTVAERGQLATSAIRREPAPASSPGRAVPGKARRDLRPAPDRDQPARAERTITAPGDDLDSYAGARLVVALRALGVPRPIATVPGGLEPVVAGPRLDVMRKRAPL